MPNPPMRTAPSASRPAPRMLTAPTVRDHPNASASRSSLTRPFCTPATHQSPAQSPTRPAWTLKDPIGGDGSAATTSEMASGNWWPFVAKRMPEAPPLLSTPQTCFTKTAGSVVTPIHPQPRPT